MDAVDLFAVALNLPSPWHISQVEFKPSKESSLELHIYIAFQRGGRFPCPQEPCGKSFPAYDTAPRRRRVSSKSSRRSLQLLWGWWRSEETVCKKQMRSVLKPYRPHLFFYFCPFVRTDPPSGGFRRSCRLRGCRR